MYIYINFLLVNRKIKKTSFYELQLRLEGLKFIDIYLIITY